MVRQHHKNAGYWVYENWVAESKAVIHTSTCGFCNNGAGTGRNIRGERNGKWHGAFGSLDEAETVARGTGRPMRRHACVPSDILPRQTVPQMPAAIARCDLSPSSIRRTLAGVSVKELHKELLRRHKALPQLIAKRDTLNRQIGELEALFCRCT